MYYADSGYTPRCWLYLLAGQSHGPINVVEAIQESCNYFFYDVGRRLTIEKMNEYCGHFGLGQPTGIELPEKTGILAGPDYRAENGLNQWSPGDTLQAAIGQSDNLFTPLQISSYLATILNGGKRYSAHLLYQVKSYGGERILYQNEPKVISEIDISDDHLEMVREGMRGVMDNGSAASVFSGYAIPVGGKTGTAQVYTTKSDNGIMMAFAPFDNPRIAVSCIIEQGSGGTEAGYSVRDVFDYYFREEIAAMAAEAETP
jgi:penicillin-binding protein 2